MATRRTLEGVVIQPDGTLIDSTGKSTGLRIGSGGYTIYDPANQVVGTLTLSGGIYDREGRRIGSVRRYDAATLVVPALRQPLQGCAPYAGGASGD